MHKKQREHGRIFHRTYTELEIMDTKVSKKKQVRELRSAGKIKLECKKTGYSRNCAVSCKENGYSAVRYSLET